VHKYIRTSYPCKQHRPLKRWLAGHRSGKLHLQGSICSLGYCAKSLIVKVKSRPDLSFKVYVGAFQRLKLNAPQGGTAPNIHALFILKSELVLLLFLLQLMSDQLMWLKRIAIAVESVCRSELEPSCILSSCTQADNLSTDLVNRPWQSTLSIYLVNHMSCCQALLQLNSACRLAGSDFFMLTES
jgi:hypothetical protein